MVGNATQTNNNSGIGFFGLLFIVLLVLKLTNYIAWSWWLVTAPLWGPIVLVGVVGLFYVAYQLIRNRR